MTSVSLAVPVWSAVAVAALTLAATRSDLRSRRIPNLLTLPALALALIAQALAGGLDGLQQGAWGALVAGGLLFPGWLLGWTGAGDVKLMAAVGAWLGYPAGLIAALASLIAGGVIALVVAIRHRALGAALRGATRIGAWAAGGAGRGAVAPPTSGLRFPFAAAILAGSWIALWIHI